MAFESLAEKLQNTFKKLRGRGKLSENDVSDALKEIRMALLEADVNFKVVKDLTAKIKERAVGQEVMESLTPAQHVIKIVNEELTALLGGTQSRIAISPKPPTVVMLVGLQGAGKTTTAGKLANLMTRQGKRPLLTAADVYRPAAIKQLHVLGENLNIPVFSVEGDQSPVNISRMSIDKALSLAKDMVIIDTAGRLHIDEDLMSELKSIKQTVKPHEILLVVDAMTGQDAVSVAQAFDEALGIDGIILTKLDGDARGGAALSVKAVTGKPIKFVGMGEKMDALEVFHPDRMSSRILGMGDVLSLIEKAESTIDIEKAQELQKKLRKEEFTLDDFLAQMEQVKKMGSFGQIMNMIPGMNKVKELKDVDLDSKEMNQVIAIIKSMTPKERQNPSIINGSRRKRIAAGSGTKVQDINRLLKQFAESKKMMKRITEMQKSGKKNSFKLPFFR